MSNGPGLYLIIGRWRTSKHSSRKEFDDSHAVKKKILKRIGRKNYSKKVGNNPDLYITPDGIIILKKTNKSAIQDSYVTDISADNYFILHFSVLTDENEVEVQLLQLNGEASEKYTTGDIRNFDQIFVVPYDYEIISLLVDKLELIYLEESKKIDKSIIVFFTL